jgi:plasmid stability protein
VKRRKAPPGSVDVDWFDIISISRSGIMAEVLIRNLDDATVARLKQRAARSERSLQAELQRIIERAASADVIESAALAARIRKKLSKRKHSDSAMLIAEDRRR